MRVPLIIFAIAISFGCRQNPECFGTSECNPGTVCFRNQCVDPRDADAGVVTFWQDVEPILAARCQTCHGSVLQNGAPFALEEFGDTQGEWSGAPVHRRMAERVSDDGNPMPPRPAAPLTPREQDLIRAWSESDAPEGLPPFSWDQDVSPIVASICQDCHGMPLMNGALIPLITYEDTQILGRSGRPVWESMGRRTNSTISPMPPAGTLDVSSRRIFRVWAATGAPERPLGGVVAPYDGGTPAGTSPLIGVGTPRTITTGYQAIEGLAWDPVEGVLYFSDAGDATIYRLTPPSIVDVLRTQSQGARGLRVDESGNVVAAESGARRVSRQTPGGANVLVADRFRGNRFNSPANVAVRYPDGTVYFTDPPLGLSADPRELPYAGLFRVTREGSVFLEWEGPNGTAPVGVTLSPDQDRLYVADRIDGVVRAFDVASGGELANERIFAFTGPGPQGITVDMNGNVYVAVAAGVEIYGPDGGLWGTLATPAIPTDVAFGGAALDMLYVSTASALYAFQVEIEGTDWRPDAPDGGVRDAGPDGGPGDAGPRNPVAGAGPYTFIQGAFRFLDGPEWVEADQELLFCDWGPGGDVIYRYSGAVGTFRTPGQQSAGLSIDPTTGDLIAAEMDARRITRTTSDGTIVPVVETYLGDQFNGPNDLIVKSNGTIYFTDPPYGLMGRPRYLTFNGLFRVFTGSTAAALEWQGDQVLDEPNGIALSPDESLLYVVNSTRNEVVVFDVMPDDSLANRRQFAPTNPIPDGMAVDADGNVYVATRDGIQVFRPDGTTWGTIINPGPGGSLRGTNLVFGGPDLTTIYVTTPQELYRFQGAVPGVSR
jgi:gluconolactonase